MYFFRMAYQQFMCVICLFWNLINNVERRRGAAKREGRNWLVLLVVGCGIERTYIARYSQVVLFKIK